MCRFEAEPAHFENPKCGINFCALSSLGRMPFDRARYNTYILQFILMKSIVAGGHTLSSLFVINNVGLLGNVMRAVASRGGKLVEMPYLLCTISWDRVGALAKKYGIDEIALCHFWPKGDNAEFPAGNPHGNGDEIERCMTTFKGIFAAVDALRSQGITVRFIDGPTWGVLAHEHKLPPADLLNSVVSFLKLLGDECEKHDLILAVEPLRQNPEDKVIGGTAAAVEILRQVERANVLLHFDFFHSLENGEDPIQMLAEAREWIGYLHLHGPKRVAPGSKNDTIDWVQASARFTASSLAWMIFPAFPNHSVSGHAENVPLWAKGCLPWDRFPATSTQPSKLSAAFN